MQAITKITRRDLLEFELFKDPSSGKGPVPRVAFAIAPPLAIMVAVLALLALFVPKSVWSGATLVSLLACFACYFLLFRSVTRRRAARAVEQSLRRPDASSLLGEQSVTLEDDGVSVVRSGQQTFYPWSEVRRVVAEGDYCYISVGPEKAIIIPSSSFADPDVFSVFVKMAVISHWNDERTTSAQDRPQAGGEAQFPSSDSTGRVDSRLALVAERSF